MQLNAALHGGHALVRYILEGADAIVPFGCPCSFCSRPDGADRPVGGCRRRGYPTLQEVRDAISRLEATHVVVHQPTPTATAGYLAAERVRLEATHLPTHLQGAAHRPAAAPRPAACGAGRASSAPAPAPAAGGSTSAAAAAVAAQGSAVC